MNNALRMRGSQAFAGLDGDVQRFVQLQGTLLDLLPHGQAFEIGHGQEGLALGFIDLVDGADIGVIEGGGGSRLSPEAGLVFLVL